VRWEHRVATRGATLTLVTGDGLTVRGADLGAVLNRLATPPLAVLDHADPDDREYARNELTAFAASWLRVLSARVVNAPDPHGLCGRWRPPLEWRALAARAGMPYAPLRLASDDASPGSGLAMAAPGPVEAPTTTPALAIDGRVLLPGAPAALQAAAARLSRLAATRILGLRFDGPDPARGGWRLHDATPYPDLSLAGEAGVAALEAALAR
jgi:hypothetical protein